MRTVFTIVLVGFLLLLALTGCTGKAEESITGKVLSVDSANARIINIEKLEIYHFHGTNQCASCIAVGDLAEETVKTHFKSEIDKGLIIFEHVNGELPENNELVMKYGATGSSLWIGTYTKDGQFKAEQNTNVWYKINDKESYISYLKSLIEKRLSGDLN